MPPKSKSQAKLFRAVAAGDTSLPGLSKGQAKEYVSGYSTKNLPVKVKKKKPARIPPYAKKK